MTRVETKIGLAVIAKSTPKYQWVQKKFEVKLKMKTRLRNRPRRHFCFNCAILTSAFCSHLRRRHYSCDVNAEGSNSPFKHDKHGRFNIGRASVDWEDDSSFGTGN